MQELESKLAELEGQEKELLRSKTATQAKIKSLGEELKEVKITRHCENPGNAEQRVAEIPQEMAAAESHLEKIEAGLRDLDKKITAVNREIGEIHYQEREAEALRIQNAHAPTFKAFEASKMLLAEHQQTENQLISERDEAGRVLNQTVCGGPALFDRSIDAYDRECKKLNDEYDKIAEKLSEFRFRTLDPIKKKHLELAGKVAALYGR